MIDKVFREYLDSYCDGTDYQTVILENPAFDRSVVGITESGQLVYNYDSMVEELAEDDNISLEEAVDFVSYDTLRAIPYFGEYKPIIIYQVEKGE